MTTDIYNSRDPRFHRTSEQVRVCNYCGAPTEEMFSGDEGATFCTDGCGCLEGEKPEYRYECHDCKSLLREDEDCGCGEREYERDEMDND